MSKINIKATIVADKNTVATENTVAKRTPVITRVQTNTGDYEFVNSLTSVRELIISGKYSIFVNYIRGKDNDAPFKKGKLCLSYKEAIEHIASQETSERYRVDLVLRNREYSSDRLAAIAANLDF